MPLLEQPFWLFRQLFPALKITLSLLSFGCSLVRGALGGSPLGEGSTGLFFSCALVPFPWAGKSSGATENSPVQIHMLPPESSHPSHQSKGEEMLANKGKLTPPHPSTYGKGWTSRFLCLIIMAIFIISVVIIIVVLGWILPLHCRLHMEGGIFRLGMLRLADQQKHSEQVDIWWQQCRFPLWWFCIVLLMG